MRASRIYVTLDLYTILVVMILFGICMVQRRQSKLINRYFIGWMTSHIFLLLCDMCRWCQWGKIDTHWLFVSMYIAEYILGYVCLLFAHYYLSDIFDANDCRRQILREAVWVICAVMSVLWTMSYRNRLFYTITYNSVNVNSSVYLLSQVPAMLILLVDVGAAYRYYKKHPGHRITLALCLPLVFPLIAFPLQNAWNVQILFISMTLSLMSCYAAISSEQSQLLAESRMQLAESRVAISMSQIQPHFLYNALGSISSLCDIDPAKARDATDHFAEYLRMNLESMERFTPIPFRRELNHIETYVWLEQMRFGDKLQVSYEIKATDFQIPALSVQPLVENAVKHGICVKEQGGSIVIRTCVCDLGYQIEVSDDGVGFDIEAEQNDGKIHVGIQNVRRRLALMVNGTLRLESRLGCGTVATITIPRAGIQTRA